MQEKKEINEVLPIGDQRHCLKIRHDHNQLNSSLLLKELLIVNEFSRSYGLLRPLFNYSYYSDYWCSIILKSFVYNRSGNVLYIYSVNNCMQLGHFFVRKRVVFHIKFSVWGKNMHCSRPLWKQSLIYYTIILVFFHYEMTWYQQEE